MTDPRFEIFMLNVTKQLDFGDQMEATRQLLWDSLNNAGYNQSAPPTKAGRGMSGWNLYMKENMSLLKEEYPSGQDRLKIIGANWKQLSTSEKDTWNQRAKGAVTTSAGTTTINTCASKSQEVGATKKVRSGWNVYMSYYMKKLKVDYPSSADRLKQIGTNWKALSEADKGKWNAIAKSGGSPDESMTHDELAEPTEPISV